ncbi:hypothetical protein FISHEDRAFT_77443 [Fistulina hepatica ATCC 64428]|uniref:Uncharacterized protein n=1 Tax=Fistulina hepatica ATCC 64428 TaxID=1128425 RepID=A0A0D7A2C4_9AGAR|nr:hypothetical protein FISHEDRAFT_77443 [Fistulina hepatica ATCC 64428]
MVRDEQGHATTRVVLTDDDPLETFGLIEDPSDTLPSNLLHSPRNQDTSSQSSSLAPSDPLATFPLITGSDFPFVFQERDEPFEGAATTTAAYPWAVPDTQMQTRQSYKRTSQHVPTLPPFERNLTTTAGTQMYPSSFQKVKAATNAGPSEKQTCSTSYLQPAATSLVGASSPVPCYPSTLVGSRAASNSFSSPPFYTAVHTFQPAPQTQASFYSQAPPYSSITSYPSAYSDFPALLCPSMSPSSQTASNTPTGPFGQYSHLSPYPPSSEHLEGTPLQSIPSPALPPVSMMTPASMAFSTSAPLSPSPRVVASSSPPPQQLSPMSHRISHAARTFYHGSQMQPSATQHVSSVTHAESLTLSTTGHPQQVALAPNLSPTHSPATSPQWLTSPGRFIT